MRGNQTDSAARERDEAEAGRASRLKRRLLRHSVLCPVSLLVAVGAAAAAEPATQPPSPPTALAQAPAETTAVYAIPAQPLANALLQFKEQSGLQLAYTTDDVRGLQSQGVDGRYSAEEALRLLLSGSGLTFAFAGEGGEHGTGQHDAGESGKPDADRVSKHHQHRHVDAECLGQFRVFRGRTHIGAKLRALDEVPGRDTHDQ